MSTQFTLKYLLRLVLVAALTTAWLQERHARVGLQLRVARLEYDIDVLAMMINKSKAGLLSLPGEHNPLTDSPVWKDDYTKDALSHPPY